MAAADRNPVNPELFRVAGDNKFANQSFQFALANETLDADKQRLFVDYSGQVFILVEFLRLVRDSGPEMLAPVVVDPSYWRAWIRMVVASSFHAEVLRKAGITPQELRDCSCVRLIRDAGH